MPSKDIAERLDVGYTTVGRWLEDLPLTKAEKSAIYSRNAHVASAGLKLHNEERGITDELRNECIRLRLHEGWSIPRLAREKNLSKGTLAYWFRGIVLNDEQRSAIADNRPPPKGKKLAIMPPMVMTPAQSRVYRHTHTAHVGYCSEMAVRHRLASLQWVSFRPEMECATKTDIIAIPGLHCRTFARIQVKTLKWTEHGHPLIPLSKAGFRKRGTTLHRRSYQISDFDLLVGYVPETDTCYVVNWDDVGDRKTSISVRPEFAEAWHKLDALFTPEDMAGRDAFWNSLASDTPDDQDNDEVE